MPKVSIITTTYKHELFIEETIKSVLGQSESDWELLIGDDSPDNTSKSIIEKYLKKCPNTIKYYYHKKNKGIVENMNFLISQIHADSKYVFFLEGDDIYTKNCLEKKISIFEKYSDVGLVYSDIDFIDKVGNTFLEKKLNTQKSKIYQNSKIPVGEYINTYHSPIISYSSVAIRKDVLLKYMPLINHTEEKTYGVSDYDLFFQISTKHKVYGIKKSLTKYRRYGGNLSNNYDKIFNELKVLIEHYRKEKLISDKIYRKKNSWIYTMKGFSNIIKNDKKNALEYFRTSLQENILYFIGGKFVLLILIILPQKISLYMLKRIIKNSN